MKVLCLLGFHRFPPKEEADGDVFRYLSQRCRRCNKTRRQT